MRNPELAHILVDRCPEEVEFVPYNSAHHSAGVPPRGIGARVQNHRTEGGPVQYWDTYGVPGVCLDMKLDCNLYIRSFSISPFRFIFLYLSFFSFYRVLLSRFRVIFTIQSYFYDAELFFKGKHFLNSILITILRF